MNRSELIDTLKDEAALNRKEAESVVNLFFDMIIDYIAQGERIEIRGFGSFSVKNYKPYIGRNPKTGDKIQVSAKRLPFFKVGKELKEKVNNML